MVRENGPAGEDRSVAKIIHLPAVEIFIKRENTVISKGYKKPIRMAHPLLFDRPESQSSPYPVVGT